MQPQLYEVNSDVLKNTCPFVSERMEKLETPVVFSDKTIEEWPVHYCSHIDQSPEGICILYKGELCNWFKTKAKKNKQVNMQIKKVEKDITTVNLKRVVEIYEKVKLHTVEKFRSIKGYNPHKGTKFDRYA